jgi:hypothetical protein
MKTRLHRSSCAGLALLMVQCAHPSGVHVIDAKEIGTISQSKLIIGRDGGGSGLVWGLSLWAFGDTVISVPDAEGQTWHHNSFSFTKNLNATNGIASLSERIDASGAPEYLVAPTADEAAFNAAHRGNPCAEQPCGARFAAWPGAPLFDAARSRALIPYGLVWAAPGDFNFRGVGQSFATWNDFASAPERPIVSPGAAHPTLLFGEKEPNYGEAAAVEGDTLFAFACALDFLTFHCTLGKVGLASVMDRSMWRYWDGARWSEKISDARPVLDASSILTVQFNQHLGQWTAAYSGVLSNDVLMRTAPALTGPWSDAVKLFTADRKGQGGTSYDAQPHAEYAEENGRILYFSYSRPTGQNLFSSELALVRVTLE